MRCGVATSDITPRRPVYLAGYAARTERSEGVYRPLLARALALDDGRHTLVWVTADLIGFDHDLAGRLTRAVAFACGVPEEWVLLSCSHTHCGPTLRAGDRELFGGDAVAGYDDELTAWLPEVAARAVAQTAECTAEFGLGHSDMGINRRLLVDGQCQMRPNPAGRIDPEVPLLRLVRPGGHEAVVLSYACHPTTMGGLLLGPDYIGYLRTKVELARPGCELLFVNGCAGDVKPRTMTPDGRFMAGPLSEVRRCGELLAEGALAGLLDELWPLDGHLATRRETIALPLQELPSADELAAAAAADEPWTRRWGERMVALAQQGPLPVSRPFCVQVVTWGESFCLLALGGEVCVEIGLRLKAELRRRWRHVMVVAYSHGLSGYQAARRQFTEGGYEVVGWYRYGDLPAPYAPDIEDHIVEAALRLADSVTMEP